MSQGEGVDLGSFPHWPNGFNGVFCNRNVFDSCVKKLIIFLYGQYILESTFHWLSKDILKFEVDIGV